MAVLSGKFDEALQFASKAHRQQTRKGTTTPYVTHLMAVSAIVGENGGDEDLMIAALLHDSMEDQGVTREEIGSRFGSRVASMVEACSDCTSKPKPPWRQRKEMYLAHLRAAGPDVRLISLADKLHNARTLLGDLRDVGPEVWKRFNAGPAETLWYYRSVIEALRLGWNHPLIPELERIIDEIDSLIKIK
ncbi:MAG: HD domain-containing protein [Candidatus Omnitrophica bacterium]|nr:HD domain-containing protein [Candidatus Omnitrophota bacterium]